MTTLSPALREKIQAIRLVVFDVDGVFTNGQIILGEQGQEFKAFNSLDGQGIKCLQLAKIDIAIITGRRSGAVMHRMQELGIETLYQGVSDKLSVLQTLLEEKQLSLAQTAYLGDDLPDLPRRHAVGFGACVANSATLVQEQADWQTTRPGGGGAVREFIEEILTIQNHWPAICAHYTGTLKDLR